MIIVRSRRANPAPAMPTVLAREGAFSVVLADGPIGAGAGASTWPCAGLRRLELHRDGAPLRSWSAAEARQCLSGRPVYMVGDSTMRYQYMSLAYFLEWGVWPERCTRAHGNDHPASIVRRGDFGNWSDYFAATERMYRGHMLCDCHIEQPATLSSASGNDASAAAPAKRPGTAPTPTPSCYRGRVEERRYSHAGALLHFEWAIAGCSRSGANLCSWHCWRCWATPQSKAEVLLLNAGIHAKFTVHNVTHPDGCYDRFIADAASYFTNGGRRQSGTDYGNATMSASALVGVWRTTDWPAGYPENINDRRRPPEDYLPPVKIQRSAANAREENRAATQAAARHGMSLLDFDVLGRLLRTTARATNTSFMWDDYHWEPVMYELLNSLFLSNVCEHVAEAAHEQRTNSPEEGSIASGGAVTSRG